MTSPTASSLPSPSATPLDRWWLARNGKAVGPYPQGELERGLRFGEVNPSEAACPEGGTLWKPLRDWPAFASLLGLQTLNPPSPLMPLSKGAWNPRSIALLGIICSPLWAGGMAAMNARRLGNGLSIWRPILIALGGFVLTGVIDACFSTTYFWTPWSLTLTIYLITLYLLWRLSLSRQWVPYTHRTQKSQAKWVWPGIIAAPLAIYVFLVFVASPFSPLEPREVAQRCLEAKELATCERYSTPRLWPAMQAIYASSKSAAEDSPVQITYDRDGDPGSHTHWVGCVSYLMDATGRHTIDGHVRMVDFDGTWKVDEIYFDAFDSHSFSQPVAISEDYHLLIPAAAPAAIATESSPQSPVPPAAVTPVDAPPVSTDTPPANAVVSPSQITRLAYSAARSAGSSAGGAEVGTAARETATIAREAETVVGHHPGGMLEGAGKLLVAGCAGAAALLLKFVSTLFGGSEPEAKSGSQKAEVASVKD
jgi:hypothetical protein